MGEMPGHARILSKANSPTPRNLERHEVRNSHVHRKSDVHYYDALRKSAAHSLIERQFFTQGRGELIRGRHHDALMGD